MQWSVLRSILLDWALHRQAVHNYNNQRQKRQWELVRQLRETDTGGTSNEGLSLESQHLPVTPAQEGDPWGFLSCQSGVGQQEQTQLYQD